ncbi:MAG: site-2 protease family protein [Candidatus Dormiibacterota bacterium]|jgi:Zn-dependent protease
MGNRPIRLGKVFGLEISFNWSLILIFLLIAWTMATEVLPGAVPNQTVLSYWVSGLAGAVVFYGCLLAHEVSHALVARSKGIQVAGITLWLFGGVTQLAGEPSGAGDEALITVVGPLTSFVIAGLGFALTAGLTSIGAPALIANLVAWLAILNLLLGVFNLVPAIPLDGGRLLSSLLWWRTGSRVRGVHLAVRVGRVFAALIIGVGLLEILFGGSGGFISGVWLGFIGFFLFSAGGAEDRQSQLRSSLRSVPVSAAMTSPVVTVPDWLTVGQLLGAGAGQSHLALYALHDAGGGLSGFVSWEDLSQLTSATQHALRLRDVAGPQESFATARPDEDLEAMLSRVGSALARGVIVTDGGQLVGTVSSAEVARIAALRRGLGPNPGLAA